MKRYHYQCGNEIRTIVASNPFEDDKYVCPCCGSVAKENIVNDKKKCLGFEAPAQPVSKKKKWVRCPDCQGRGWYDKATMEKLHIENGDQCRNCGGSGRCLETSE